MTEIFIASSSIDEPNYRPVVEEIHSLGYEASVYRADKVASGEDRLTMHVDPAGNMLTTYDGDVLSVLGVAAAWYRRPNLIGLDYENKAKQLQVESEIVELQDALWQSIPDSLWLNSPGNISKARIKLGQLSLAASLGFVIPETIISNDWEDIEETLGQYDEAIMKMPKGVLYEGSKTQVLYATRLTAKERKRLDRTLPFPAIFQPYKTKFREWRVTIVGDEAFEATIYTHDDAKDDWRKHQLDEGKVEFQQGAFPDDLKERCFDFLNAYGLRFGAFDFIETTEGQMVFLECNPNGQYGWLETRLGFPISKAIASELIKITKDK